MRIRKPILIDKLIYGGVDSTKTEYKGRWYIAKPIHFYGIEEFFNRCYHAWLVFIGKAEAVQYIEDRI
jgi:hypothetical protein